MRTQVNRWARNGRFLPSAEDPEAVHNYRVALRRLRTLLRAFRPWLPSIAPGVRRRLRRLMRGTSEPRNLEVLLAWVAAETGALTARQQVGAQWFASRLQV
ncbi:MAG TPA: CHAD domain-containing protein, partial [Gemmatimonadales bacterium]|nr:CHAD domain-containing protein [Gemmatimonadales bacterium]